MNAEKVQNGGRDGIRVIGLVLYFAAAAVSGSGGTYIWLRTTGPDIIAPDRYTGTQASALISQVHDIEIDLRNHKLMHPDRALELRLSVLESNYEHLISTLDRIEKKIDNGRQ